ncbi:polyphosphate:nucleotide phosphotransferase, PPK2 family [Sphingobacterium spiritivorum]|uniref:Polyphosphate:nucleotide phosphotransferase, PPK2 family n=3 Tax=Sphingobacterium spiritivorum TaxID=258 RepID=D7VMH4_SPHSI|nr:polyphosphate:nucleotide phosphotransferase, PPK2 family [Sphingobacterium spiritivorum ATCC 33861]SUJ00418.1 polyphosphate:nucleotide phosphotransferase, PPK2 family [Sphingobacterium spiritivorum]
MPETICCNGHRLWTKFNIFIGNVDIMSPKTNYSKRLQASKNFKISDHATDISEEISVDEATARLKDVRKKLSKLQDVMYAHDKYNVLVCLQGMDTAGKDSLIREVFAKFNVRGVDVQSFKTPSEKEHQHDYLWRHYIALPEKGKFGVFNRTHYENVLVTRVHPSYLLSENLPDIREEKDVTNELWEKRYEQITNFENHLIENGTILFKFFLNLSKDEQKNRLLRRLEKEKHQWKFSPGDLSERQLWDKYMEYYEEAIQHTSKKKTPWYIIPSDCKETARYLVAQIMLEVLEQYTDIKYPELSEEIQGHIKKYKNQLENE